MNSAKSVNELRQEIRRYLQSHVPVSISGAITHNIVESHLRTYIQAGVDLKDAAQYLASERGPHDEYWQDCFSKFNE